MASLFDTGAFERLQRDDREASRLAIRWHPPLVCLHTAVEYFYGLAWVGVSDADWQQARENVEKMTVLLPNADTAAVYAKLRADARRAGKQMPDPDFWIAAHALDERLPLVTTDRHFLFFEELDVHLLD